MRQPAGDNLAFGGRRLVALPDLLLETHDGRHAVVVDAASGTRLKLSAGLYRLLSGFDAPRAPDQLADVAGDPRIAAGVRVLLERGLLVDADRPAPVAQKPCKAVPYRFCGAPRCAATPGDAGFVVLGVPYDLGGPGSSRDGPLSIRQKSLDYAYLLDAGTHRPRGWFDPSSGARILEGASMADAGDVHVVYGERQADTFARVEQALALTLGARRVPLLLGGDRSLCFVLARHLAAARRLSVLQLVPETTLAPSEGDLVTVHDVGRRMLELDGVASCAMLGIRAGAAERAGMSVDAVRAQGAASAVRQAGMADDVLLMVDIGVLDAGRPPDGTGFSLREVKAIVEAVGQRHGIAGIGIFGLDPAAGAGELLGIAACHIALHAMHAASRSWKDAA